MPSLLLVALLALGAGVGVGELQHQQQNRAVEQQAGSVAVVGLTLLSQDVGSATRIDVTVRVDNRGARDVTLREVSLPGTPLVSDPLDRVLAPGDDTLVPLSTPYTCTGSGASLRVPDPVVLQAVVRTSTGAERTSRGTVTPVRQPFFPGLADLDQSCGVPARDSPPYVLPRGIEDAAPGVVRISLTVQNQTRGPQRVLGLVTESGRPVTLTRDGQPENGPVDLPSGTPDVDGPVVTLAGEYVCGPPDPQQVPVTLLLRYDTGPGTPVGVTGVVVFTTRSPGTTSSCG